MGQQCSDDRDCCLATKAADLEPAKLPRTAVEDLGSPANINFSTEDGTEDGSSATGSPRGRQHAYFDNDRAELSGLLKTGGVENKKAYTFKSGAVYTGQWQNNMRHGFGTQRWKDGSSYSGQWKNNCAAGKGRFTHHDGDCFIGEWRENMANGLGIFFRSGMMAYQGQCKDDLQDGYGVELKVDGSKYEGSFRGGRKDGPGCFQWPDGSKYQGQWRGDGLTGHGTFIHPRWTYRGQWKDSSKHGIGEYTNKTNEGSTHAGCFVDDQQHGFGVFSWPDGTTFEGFWKSGTPTGSGRSKSGENGAIQWVNGKMQR